MGQEESEKTSITAAEYVELYKQARELAVDRDVALAVFQEMAKDIRIRQIKQERTQKANGAASEKQKAYLRRLGVEFGQAITREEASRLIDEAVDREG
jgi:hypothetical protein